MGKPISWFVPSDGWDDGDRAAHGARPWCDGRLTIMSLRQCHALCLRRQPDNHQTGGVDQADCGPGLCVTSVEHLVAHQEPSGQRAAGRDDSSKVVAKSLARCPHPGWKQLRQVQRQPAVERCREGSYNGNGCKELPAYRGGVLEIS